jgi:hypothetical protein
MGIIRGMSRGWKTTIVCALLLAMFAALAWTSVIRESATFDEPLHVVAAHVVSHRHDFRVNPEDPPLWEYWANLPHSASSLQVDYSSEIFQVLLSEPNVHWKFVIDALYRPGGDADAFLNASRAMMLVIGVALGATLCWIAWKMGGMMPAICGAILFSLCPNFLGHAPLVKNDVTFSLEILCLMAGLWRVGIRLTPWNVLAVALAATAALTSKFSGVLVAPMVFLVLLTRAAWPVQWPVLGKTAVTFRARFGAAILAGLFVAGVSFIGIWAVYGFRFAPTPEGKLIDSAPLYNQAARNQVTLRHPTTAPTDAEVDAVKVHPPMLVKFVAFAEKHRLLPQAWVDGLLYTYLSSLLRGSFLLGKADQTGWWYYFPLAALFKTPLATIAAALAAGVWGFFHVVPLRRSQRAPQAGRLSEEQTRAIWTATAFGIPWIIYAAAAMTTHLNIGLRHIFPLYPPVFLMIALAAGKLWEKKKIARWLIPIFAIGLATETLAAYPHFIAFFNAPSQAYGPLNLLSDSNLDWGQDLPLLVQWQKKHPNVRMYCAYFGTAPPGYYGLRYLNLPGGYMFQPEDQFTPGPGVIAISATAWQGVYSRPQVRELYFRTLPKLRLVDVLGGTIFILEVPGKR